MAKPLVPSLPGTIIAGGPLSQSTIIEVNKAATKARAEWRRFIAYAKIMRCLTLVAALFAVHSLVHAGEPVAVGCKTVQLVLDERVTPSELDRLWASGESPAAGAPAVLQLHGCSGELLDSRTLEAPLAKLESAPLRGVRPLAVLVTVDLTAPAGSYSGPLTRPFQVDGNRLAPAQARATDGRMEPIVLAQTGKAAWKKVTVRGADQFMAVRSEPLDGGFTTRFSRYVPGPQGWRVRERSQPGLWESDGEFPARRSFP